MEGNRVLKTGKEMELHFTACDYEEAACWAVEGTESCHQVSPSPLFFYMTL